MRCLIRRWRSLAAPEEGKSPADALDAHAKKCPDCQAFLDSDRHLSEALSEPVSEPEHSPGFHSRVMGAVRAVADGREAPEPSGFKVATVLAGGFAAALMTVAILWTSQPKRNPEQEGKFAGPSVELPAVPWNVMSLARDQAESLVMPLDVEFEQVQSDFRRLAELGWGRWQNLASESVWRHESR